jgi:hypothetical protein
MTVSVKKEVKELQLRQLSSAIQTCFSPSVVEDEEMELGKTLDLPKRGGICAAGPLQAPCGLY